MGSNTKNRRYKGGSPAGPKRPYSERNGPLITDEEAADELAVTKAMIYKLIRSGDLKRVKVRSLNRLTRASLDAYIARLTGDGR